MIDKPIEYADDDLSHLDADDVLIVDYLAGALSSEQAAAVETRLTEDDAFLDKAAPHIRLWMSPVKYRPMLEAIEHQESASNGKPVFALRPSDRERLKSAGQWAGLIGLGVAATLLIVSGTFRVYGDWALRHQPQAAVIVPTADGSRKTVDGRGTRDAGLGTRDSGLGTRGGSPPSVATPKPRNQSVAPVPTPVPVPVPKPEVTTPPKPVVTTPPAAKARVDTIPHVRLSPWGDSVPGRLRRFLGDTTAITGVGETLDLTLASGSRVVLQPETYFRWVDAGFGIQMGVLEGEIAIDVAPAVHLLRINTAVGFVALPPGSFAIRCASGCSELLITVQRGSASLSPNNPAAGFPSLEIKQGMFGRFPAGGTPERTTGGDQYPKPIRADSAGRGSIP